MSGGATATETTTETTGNSARSSGNRRGLRDAVVTRLAPKRSPQRLPGRVELASSVPQRWREENSDPRDDAVATPDATVLATRGPIPHRAVPIARLHSMRRLKNTHGWSADQSSVHAGRLFQMRHQGRNPIRNPTWRLQLNSHLEAAKRRRTHRRDRGHRFLFGRCATDQPDPPCGASGKQGSRAVRDRREETRGG